MGTVRGRGRSYFLRAGGGNGQNYLLSMPIFTVQ